MTDASAARPPVRVFYSYAHEDAALRDALAVALSPLRRRGLIMEWYDNNMLPSEEWEARGLGELARAHLILLLISPDFLNSDYCYTRELPLALERHQQRAARVMPVYLRPVDVRDLPFTHLQGVPAPDYPVIEWPQPDAAWAEVATKIRQVVEELAGPAQSQPGSAGILHASDAGGAPALPGQAAWRRRGWRLGALLVLLVLSSGGYYANERHRASLHVLDAGKRYLDTGQYQRAQQACQQARAAGWLWLGAAQSGLDKATLYDAGKLPDIAQRLETLLAQHPNDAHLHLFQGDVYAQQQAYEPARRISTPLPSIPTWRRRIIAWPWWPHSSGRWTKRWLGPSMPSSWTHGAHRTPCCWPRTMCSARTTHGRKLSITRSWEIILNLR